MMEKSSHLGNIYTKVKCEITVHYRLMGMKDQAWNFLKIIIGLIFQEIFHNCGVNFQYIRVLTSEFYIKCHSSRVTYDPKGNRSLLWGSTTMRWITASAFTPTHLATRNLNFYHDFPMSVQGVEPLSANYRVTFSQRPYLGSEREVLMDQGHFIAELKTPTKCKHVLEELSKHWDEITEFSLHGILSVLNFNKLGTTIVSPLKVEAELDKWGPSHAATIASKPPALVYKKGVVQNNLPAITES